MDNGHPKTGNQMTGIFSAPAEAAMPPVAENPYFTAGVGNISPDVNGDLENSIDKEDWERSLEISAPVGIPAPEQIVNTKIASTEDAGLFSAENLTSDNPVPKAQETQAVKIPENPYELGRINPVAPQAPIIPDPIPEVAKNDDFAPILIEGDRMSRSGIKKAEKAEEKLNQDGQLAPFYDEIRGIEKQGLTDEALYTSFKRVIGEDQGKAA